MTGELNVNYIYAVYGLSQSGKLILEEDVHGTTENACPERPPASAVSCGRFYFRLCISGCGDLQICGSMLLLIGVWLYVLQPDG